MRHYEIGKIEYYDNFWTVRFYDDKLFKKCINFEEALEKANEELKSFVDFANEGAAFRVESDEGIYFHLLDIEEEGYEEYDLTMIEFFETHFFYMNEEDKKQLKKSKSSVVRNEEQQKWFDEELEKIKFVKTMPEKAIAKRTKELNDEMSNFVKEYIKTLED